MTSPVLWGSVSQYICNPIANNFGIFNVFVLFVSTITTANYQSNALGKEGKNKVIINNWKNNCYFGTESFKTQYKQNFAISSTSTTIPWKTKLTQIWTHILSYRISEQAQQEARNIQIWQEAECKNSCQSECSGSFSSCASMQRILTRIFICTHKGFW